LTEIVDLPPNVDMYQEGERQKCRYPVRVNDFETLLLII
jgi:hypothetical protein